MFHYPIYYGNYLDKVERSTYTRLLELYIKIKKHH